MRNNQKLIHLTPHKNNELDDVKGWDGFIAPNGNFYKVAKKNKMESKLDLFAEGYVCLVLKKDIYEEWNKFQEERIRCNDIDLPPAHILINIFGFINYRFLNDQIIITCPSSDYKELDMTDEQLTTLYLLTELNDQKVVSIKETKPLSNLINEKLASQKEKVLVKFKENNR